MKKWEFAMARLGAEFENREKEQDLLHEIDKMILRKAGLTETFFLVVRELRRLFGNNHAALILLRRSNELHTESSDPDVGGHHRPLVGSTLQGLCVTKREIITLADIEQEDLGRVFEDYPGGATKSVILLPILEGETGVGVLGVYCSRAGAFDDQTKTFLEGVARQLSVAIEHAHFFDEQQLYSEVDSLVFGSAGTQSVVEDALSRIMAELNVLAPGVTEAVQVLFPRGDVLEVVYSSNPDDVGFTVGSRSVCGKALTDRAPVYVEDVKKAEWRDVYRAMFQGMRSELAIPIRISDVPIAVLNFESSQVDAFPGYERALLHRFAGKIAVLLAFARLKDDVIVAMEQQQADELLRAVGEEAALMVHDVNSAVGKVHVRMTDLRQLLESQESTDGRLNTLLDRMETGLGRILERPNQLRDRLVQERVIDISAAVDKGVSAIANDQLGLIEVDVTGVPDDLPDVEAPSFDRVIENLVRNSIEAIGSDRPGKISISARAVERQYTENAWVEILIDDDGPGIPPELWESVFQPGVSITGRARSGSGLGFGLWWIRQSIRRCGGEIAIQEAPIGGARFWIRLPVSKEGEGT